MDHSEDQQFDISAAILKVSLLDEFSFAVFKLCLARKHMCRKCLSLLFMAVT